MPRLLSPTGIRQMGLPIGEVQTRAYDMTNSIWGATPEEWAALINLCAEDVRPCVSNPEVRPSATSTVTDATKVPTIIGSKGSYTGLYGWQKLPVEPSDLLRWQANPDHGAGLIGKNIRAIDIDIDDEVLAAEVAEYIESHFGELPTRCRYKSPRKMMLYQIIDADEVIVKQVVKMAGGKGMVEFLFDRQFFALAGTHKSGNRMYFPDGMPTSMEEIPPVAMSELLDLIRGLNEEFGESVDDFDLARTKEVIDGREMTQVNFEDFETNFVLNSDSFRQILPNGIVAVDCPWQHLHSSTGGMVDEDPTKVVYFPKGLGGRETSGFKCHHASHPEKNVTQFLEALGYVTDEFEYLGEVEEKHVTRPEFDQTKKGAVPATGINLDRALKWAAGIGWEIREDDFRKELQIREYPNGGFEAFRDTHYARLGKALEAVGFKGVPKERLRDAVALVGEDNRVDAALDWANGLVWDGIPRVDRFHYDVMGARDTPYARAVGRYLWTAMAARASIPGCKADMVPVLVGRQGVRKSTMIELLSPIPEWAGKLDLGARDDDASRTLRGKLVVELDELRGLASRDEDSIKSWIAKTHDEWIPKYKEFAVVAPRRFVMIGSSNKPRFLVDNTGNRRWLPLKVCETKEVMDTELLKKNVVQYWAEAMYIVKHEGIQWKDAESLAIKEHDKFTMIEPWDESVVQWLRLQEIDGFTTGQVLQGALYIEPQRHQRQQLYQVARILTRYGYEEGDDSIWRTSLA